MAYVGQNAALAWVHHNGSNTIAESYNVSSVSRNGTGHFTINLSITLPNSNYVAVAGAASSKTSNGTYLGSAYPKDTSSYFHYGHWTNGTGYDLAHNFSALFGERY